MNILTPSAVLFAIVSSGCGAASEPEVASREENVVNSNPLPVVDDDLGQRISSVSVPRMQTDIEVLSASLSEACGREGMDSPSCSVINSSQERTIVRYAGSGARQDRIDATVRYIRDIFNASVGASPASEILDETYQGSESSPYVALLGLSANGLVQHDITLTFPGTQCQGEAIVFGGHHDSTTVESGPAPGAIDNGTGLAVLFEMARIFGTAWQQGIRPTRTIHLVAFASEEGPTRNQGSYGSRAWVASATSGSTCSPTCTGPISCLPRIRAMLNLDMVGLPRWKKAQSGQLVAFDTSQSSHVARLFAQPATDACPGANVSPADSIHQHLGRSLGLTVQANSKNWLDDFQLLKEPTADRTTGGFLRFSDHFSFHDAGVPSLRLIGPNAVDEAGINHTHLDRTTRNPRDEYPRSTDPSDSIIDWDHLGRVARASLLMADALAFGPGSPETPQTRAVGDGQVEVSWSQIPGAAKYVVALRGDDNSPAHEVAMTMTVEGTLLTIPSSYLWASVAAVDSQGRIGHLSQEVPIAGECSSVSCPALSTLLCTQ